MPIIKPGLVQRPIFKIAYMQELEDSESKTSTKRYKRTKSDAINQRNSEKKQPYSRLNTGIFEDNGGLTLFFYSFIKIPVD